MPETFDLAVLAADKDIEQTLHGVLESYAVLGIRLITYKILIHPRHDSGMVKDSAEQLRPLIRQAHFAVALFDYEGCGRDDGRDAVEVRVENHLHQNGWDGRAVAVAIVPELENWLRICLKQDRSENILGWPCNNVRLRDFFAEEGTLSGNQRQLHHPKETFAKALRKSRIQRSSSLYYELAKSAPINQCTDPSFEKLRRTLQSWFPINGGSPQRQGEIIASG